MPDHTPQTSPEIDALLSEDRRFEPSAAFRAAATVNDPEIYARAAADPEAFWAGFAGELEWMKPWDTVLEWTPPTRSGSSAASSTPASTASIVTSADRAATRPPSSGKANRASGAR